MPFRLRESGAAGHVRMGRKRVMASMSIKRALIILVIAAIVIVGLLAAFGIETFSSGGIDPGSVVPAER